VHVREHAEDLVGDVAVVRPVELGGLSEDVIAFGFLDFEDFFVVGFEVLPPDFVCGSTQVTVDEFAAEFRCELEDQVGDFVDCATVGFSEDSLVVDEAGSICRAVMEELDESVLFYELVRLGAPSR